LILSNQQILNSDPRKGSTLSPTALVFGVRKSNLDFWIVDFEDSEEIRNGQLPGIDFGKLSGFYRMWEKNPNPINSNELAQRFFTKGQNIKHSKS